MVEVISAFRPTAHPVCALVRVMQKQLAAPDEQLLSCRLATRKAIAVAGQMRGRRNEPASVQTSSLA